MQKQDGRLNDLITPIRREIHDSPTIDRSSVRGRGATAAPGTQSDHLASQGSLAYDPQRQVLIAVNAGSDSISAFSVHGDRLRLTSVVSSDGPFPASIAVHGNLVYVLDSGGRGTVHPARADRPHLTSPPESRLLYAETGGGTVQEFRVNGDGTLTRLGDLAGLPAGIEGIVAA